MGFATDTKLSNSSCGGIKKFIALIILEFTASVIDDVLPKSENLKQLK